MSDARRGQQTDEPPMTMADLDFTAIVEKFGLEASFAAELEQQAAEATDRFAGDRLDARDLELVTIDPPGSRDLDQAVRVERGTEAGPDGFTLHYAIADVGAFVAPGSPLDIEAKQRGETVYLPNGTIPLYPRALTEQIASLVAGKDRPAVLWQIETDTNGVLRRARVRRAVVRVRTRLDYPGLQALFDRGEPLPEPIEALPAFGELRQRRARERGAIELQLPVQDLVRGADGWHLRLEPRTRMDGWNSECSLATGIAAARIMLAGGEGMLRTLPAPDARTTSRFRKAARALGVQNTDELPPGELLARLDATEPAAMALNAAATRLLRGAGYLTFSTRPAQAEAWHAGVAGSYAHATAPIRRLGDRFVSEVCLAFGGEWLDLDDDSVRVSGQIPDEIMAALPELPGLLARSGRIASDVENACINLAEAVALQNSIGEVFYAGLLRSGDDEHLCEVFVYDPPVIAQCRGEVPAGERVRVRLAEVDTDQRRVRFEYPAD